MNRFCYAFARRAGRFIGGLAVRHRAEHPERLWRGGGFVVACTHLGHVEPFVLSGTLRRPVHWLARAEFFRVPALAVCLRSVGMISLDRRGVPVRAVRRAIDLARRGEIVGIFPEGGRAVGPDSVLRDGPVKGGAALIALRAGVPMVPVVVLGTEAMHGVEAWLPGRCTPIRTIVGEPIFPPRLVTRDGRRQARADLTLRLRRAFVEAHAGVTAKNGRPS